MTGLSSVGQNSFSWQPGEIASGASAPGRDACSAGSMVFSKPSSGADCFVCGTGWQGGTKPVNECPTPAPQTLEIDYTATQQAQIVVQNSGNTEAGVRGQFPKQQRSLQETLNLVRTLLGDSAYSSRLVDNDREQLEALMDRWTNVVWPNQKRVQAGGNQFQDLVPQYQMEQRLLNDFFKILDGPDKLGLRGVDGTVLANVINRVYNNN